MPRSPLRIAPFLRQIEAVWEREPDQRFGQLVMNITREPDGSFADPWNWENSEWSRRIDAYLARRV
jgi:hypothetical protein